MSPDFVFQVSFPRHIPHAAPFPRGMASTLTTSISENEIRREREAALVEGAWMFLQAAQQRRVPGSGCRQAWSDFRSRYYPCVRRHVRKSLQGRNLSPVAVEDAAEEAWTAGLLGLWQGKYDLRRGAFKAWLLRVVDNRLRNLVRRHVDQVRLELGEYEAYLADDHVDGEAAGKRLGRQELVQTAIERLRSLGFDKECAVLRLRRLEGLSNDEIAARLGLRPRQVRRRDDRAMTELRALLMSQLDAQDRAELLA